MGSRYQRWSQEIKKDIYANRYMTAPKSQSSDIFKGSGGRAGSAGQLPLTHSPGPGGQSPLRAEGAVGGGCVCVCVPPAAAPFSSETRREIGGNVSPAPPSPTPLLRGA